MVDIARVVQKLIAPLRRRVQLMVSRAVIRVIDDSLKGQELQITGLAGEVLDGVEHIQTYGLTSHPHPGAEAIALAVGGSRSHAVVVAVGDRRYRLTGLAQGEVALHDDLGQKIILHRDRIELTSPKVVIVSDDIHLAGVGGPAVARIGDNVNVATGSSAGLWPIVEGSAKVKAN
ncbi:MAG: hypothetical protein COA65_08850 [Rhodospirillaceae bacterium]|nr:MAG: hypothetical protein COA65_08850 [Rhodospirillaceae bacterium]